MHVNEGRRCRERKISAGRAGIELNIENRMQFDHIGGGAVLVVKKIEEAYASYAYRNVGGLK